MHLEFERRRCCHPTLESAFEQMELARNGHPFGSREKSNGRCHISCQSGVGGGANFPVSFPQTVHPGRCRRANNSR
jgi:hypothetical protein